MQQSSISPGRLNTTGPDRNQGKGWLGYAAGTNAAGDIVYQSGMYGNALAFTKAGADLGIIHSGPLFVAVHAGVANAPLRVVSHYMLNGINTNSAVAAGDPVFLSDTDGSWSLTPGTSKRRIGTVVVKSATVGSILLCPGEFTPVMDTISNTAASTAQLGTVETLTNFDKTYTIKANRLKPGSRVHVRACGIHTGTTGAETHDMLLRFGTIAIATKSGVDPADNDIFFFDFDIIIRTATTLVATGTIAVGASGTAAPVTVLLGSTVCDTTIDNIVAIAIDRQAAAADTDSCRLDILAVEVYD